MKAAKQNLLLFDGNCPFCTQQARMLKNKTGGILRTESFQDPAVLAQFPELTHEDCMKEIKLVTAEGKILGGAEAIFFALCLNPFYRPFCSIYWVPGLRQIFNLGYKIIAKNRYSIQQADCPTGTCSKHPHS